MAPDPARFYGASIPKQALALRDEDLTYALDTKLSLVDAHLSPNDGYFGALDKTLSGLFILDDTGDDYTVLDLREAKGHVYYLGHDEISLTPHWKSLADYAKWRAAQSKDEPRTLPRAFEAKPKRSPDTRRLWLRMRWLSWLFSQRTPSDDEEVVATALETLRLRCQDDYGKYRKAFTEEKKGFARDPHVAIFWLLTFTCLGLDAERTEVIDAVAKVKHPLLRAFVDVFGAMGSDAELKVLPAFRKRRAAVVFALAEKLWRPAFELYAKSFEIDPETASLDKALAIWRFAKTDADRARIAVLAKGPSVGALYLRAELAASANKPIAVDALVAADPYRPRVLELAIAGGAKGLAKQLAEARAVDALLAAVDVAATAARKTAKTIADLDKGTAAPLAKLKKAPPLVRELAARRIAARPDQYTDATLATAAASLLASKLPDRVPLFAHVAMAMHDYAPVKAAAAKAAKGDPSSLDVLDALLAYDESRCNEYHAQYVKEFALAGLGARLVEPARWTRLLVLLGKHGRERYTWMFLADVLGKKSDLLAKLSVAQQTEVAIALLAHSTEKLGQYDRRFAAMHAVLSERVHRDVLAWLAKARDKGAARRYVDILEDLDLAYVREDRRAILAFAKAPETKTAILAAVR